ncbi:energy transducer TonB [Winogradskyella algicola]|uniref:hypothetical protein n=1 Tax=Winogradskyella algicola TaxID=2575815 RepID=UPI001108E983|nr:hypothetical protein [Winogradskyella algicola]
MHRKKKSENEPIEEVEEIEEEVEEEFQEVEILEITSNEESDFIPFYVVDEVPYLSDCKSIKEKKKRKTCVQEYIQMHVMRKFNSEVIEGLGLAAGKKRIFAQFKIDKQGKVINVLARGPHPVLEREVERVINLLPEFTPGIHQGETVIVAYSLPIIFTVEEYEVKDDQQKN